MPEYTTTKICPNCRTRIIQTRIDHITQNQSGIPLKAEPKTLTPEQATSLLLLNQKIYWHTIRHGHHYIATHTPETSKWIKNFRTKDTWNLIPHHYCKRKQPGKKFKPPPPPPNTETENPKTNTTPWGANPDCNPPTNPPF